MNEQNIPRNPEVEAIINQAFDPGNAADVLERLLKRPHARGDSKSRMTMQLDMALCKAIISLRKEALGKRDTDEISCDHLNKNRIYVSNEVYELMKSNPDRIFVDSKGKSPMVLKVVGFRGLRAKINPICDDIEDGVSEEDKLKILEAFSRGEKDGRENS